MDSVANGMPDGKDSMANMLKEMLKISGSTDAPCKSFDLIKKHCVPQLLVFLFMLKISKNICFANFLQNN